MQALFDFPDRGSRYAWRVMAGTLSYAAALVPEICDSIAEMDEAMRLGYNWKYGPFELIDRIGAHWFARRLEDKGLPVPNLLGKARGRGFYRVENGMPQYLGVDGNYVTVRRPEGVLLLEDIKRASKPLLGNASAALWDIGDGVTCFEITTKMNTLNDEVVSLLKQAVDLTGEGFKAMVIYSESANFSLGADLRMVRSAIANGEWNRIEDTVEHGQRVYAYLKHAPVPVVGAPSGMALGERVSSFFTVMQFRRTPKPTWDLSKSASGSSRLGADARNCCFATTKMRDARVDRCRRSCKPSRPSRWRRFRSRRPMPGRSSC